MIIHITKKLVARVNRIVNPPKREKLAVKISREAQRNRLLTGYRHESDDEIVLRALKQQNFIAAFGLNPGDLEELCRYFAQKGLPKI